MFTEELLKFDFYKGVYLYEQRKFRDSFKILLDCAQKGNLYAINYVFYIDKHLTDLYINPNKDQTEKELKEFEDLVKEQKKILETLQETYNNQPTDDTFFQPESWLQASNLKIDLNKDYKIDCNDQKSLKEWLINNQSEEEQNKISSKKKLIENLQQLAPNCTNAYVLLFQINKILKINTTTILVSVQKTQNKNQKSKKENSKSIEIKLPKISIIDFYYVCNMIEEVSLEEDASQIQNEMQMLKNYSGHENSLMIERILAKSYEQGKVFHNFTLKQDRHRQFKWQKTGALLGNPELAFMFSKFDKISKNNNLNWLKIAANNMTIAKCILASLYCFGCVTLNPRLPTIQINKDKAFSIYEKLLDVFIAICSGKSLSDNQEIIAAALVVLGNLYEERKNDKTAFICYSNSLKLGNHDGIYNTAIFLEYGRGTEKNIEESIKLFHLIPKQSVLYRNSIKHLARIFCKEKKDYTQCLKYTSIIVEEYNKNHKSPDFTDPESLFVINLHYEIYYRELSDIKKEGNHFDTLVKLAKNDNYYSAITILDEKISDLKEFCNKYNITTQTIEKWLNIGIKHKIKSSFSLFGNYYLQHENKSLHSKALNYFYQGAENNEVLSLDFLGQLYSSDNYRELNIQRDNLKALDYFIRSTKLSPNKDNKAGYNNIGVLYLKLEKYELALDYFKQALNFEEYTAALNIPITYLKMHKLEEKEYQEEFFKYLTIAEQYLKDEDVFYYLALCHFKGYGVEISMPKYSEYLFKALEQGHELTSIQILIDYATLKMYEILTKKTINYNMEEQSWELTTEERDLLSSILEQFNYLDVLEIQEAFFFESLLKLLLNSQKYKSEISEEIQPYLIEKKQYEVPSERIKKSQESSKYSDFSKDRLIEFLKTIDLDSVLANTSKKSSEETISSFHDHLSFLNEILLSFTDITMLHILGLLSAQITSKEELKVFIQTFTPSTRILNSHNNFKQIKTSDKPDLIKDENPNLQPLNKDQSKPLLLLKELTDEKNVKQIELEEFQSILKNLNDYFPEMKLQILPSKGSNIRHKIEIGEETICWGIHPTHKKDHWIDRKRNNSIRDIATKVHNTIGKKYDIDL